MKQSPDTKPGEWFGVAFFAVLIVAGIAAIVAIIMGY